VSNTHHTGCGYGAHLSFSKELAKLLLDRFGPEDFGRFDILHGSRRGFFAGSLAVIALVGHERGSWSLPFADLVSFECAPAVNRCCVARLRRAEAAGAQSQLNPHVRGHEARDRLSVQAVSGEREAAQVGQVWADVPEGVRKVDGRVQEQIESVPSLLHGLC
jgi:hypothetical protein